MSYPLGKGYSEGDWVSYFAKFTTVNPKMPRYTGTNPAAKGKTWDGVYKAMWAAGQKLNPKATPDQVAQAEIELIQVQAVAQGIGAVVTVTGNLPEQSVKSITQGASEFAAPITGLLGFLGDITSANLWIRVAKVAVGGTILIVGLLKLTGADKTAGSIASKAVKVAPLL
jgi:hypothetical protein